ncbi:hypothetical protein GCM10009760_11060 [Kitasatospora kazusensis]|uniref:Uncharacterized protein n=1 Tax=Kitasatospora kazusensis TaxID=407974 RepID=A0ABN2YYP0_9ACTN
MVEWRPVREQLLNDAWGEDIDLRVIGSCAPQRGATGFRGGGAYRFKAVSDGTSGCRYGR